MTAKGLKPGDIGIIIVRTYTHAVDLVGEYKDDTPYKAKFSLPFCLGAAFIGKKLDLSSFDFSVPVNPIIKELARRCEVVVDPELEKKYPGCWAASIEVILKDGTHLHASTDYPRGDPENPASADEIRNKFKDLAILAWPVRHKSKKARM